MHLQPCTTPVPYSQHQLGSKAKSAGRVRCDLSPGAGAAEPGGCEGRRRAWVVVEGAEGPDEHAEVDGEALARQEAVGLLHQPPRHCLEQVPLPRDQLHPLGVLSRQPPQHIGAALHAAAEMMRGSAAAVRSLLAAGTARRTLLTVMGAPAAATSAAERWVLLWGFLRLLPSSIKLPGQVEGGVCLVP